MLFLQLIVCFCAIVWCTTAELSGSWSLQDVNNLIKSMKTVREQSQNPRDLFFAQRFLEKFPQEKKFDCQKLKSIQSKSLGFLDWFYLTTLSEDFGCDLSIPSKVASGLQSTEVSVSGDMRSL